MAEERGRGCGRVTGVEPEYKPRVGAEGVPWCDEACPQHDGKRCRLIGFRPGSICEPAVVAMAARVVELEAEMGVVPVAPHPGTEIVVTDCGGCPWFADLACHRGERRSLAECEVCGPPSWCPLRHGAVVVRLGP